MHYPGLRLCFELYYLETILTFAVESVSLGEPRQKRTLVSRSFTTVFTRLCTNDNEKCPSVLSGLIYRR